MILQLGKKTFSDSELRDKNLRDKVDSKTGTKVLSIIHDWNSGAEVFSLTTSGSTGDPKKIDIPRKALIYSARTSMQYLDPNQKFQSTLLCISPEFIGGLMVIIRALIYDLNLTVSEPSSNPLKDLEEDFDLVSMVPLQVQTIIDQTPEKLGKVRTLLIGGAPLNESYIEKLQPCTQLRAFQTYGMTETASHIALKPLNDQSDCYKTLGDIEIGVNDKNCLKIRGSVTNGSWIQTNDIVEIIARDQFKWIGRQDLVINSGGYKIQVEKLESALSSYIQSPYFLAGIDDKKLGEKVVLLVEGKTIPELNFEGWHPYEIPKEVFRLDHFSYTESGKIDRNSTLKQLVL